MFSTVLTIVLPALGALMAGLVLGRILWGQAAAEEAVKAAQLRRVVDRLRDVAMGLADHVGEHNSRVRQISEELITLHPAREDDIVRSVEGILQASQVMMARLESSERQLSEQARELQSRQQEARTDALTGLANRRAFDEAMTEAAKLWATRRIPATVAILDVDHFKKFNDTHGHAVGDLVLKGVAGVIRKATPDRYLAVRYGGEEFAVVFPGATLDQVTSLAETARRTISETSFTGTDRSVKLRVTSSCGVAQLRSGEPVADWLERADKALYYSKQAGRNCGHLHDGSTFAPLVPAETTTAMAEETPNPPYRDEATGLTLKAGWCDDLKRHLAHLCRGTDHLSVILVAVDDYPALVEVHGPQINVLVGQTVSQHLRSTCRTSDHHGLWTDGQFVTTFPSARSKQAATVAERLRAAIEATRVPLDDGELRLTVRIVATPCFHTDSIETILGRLETSIATTDANHVYLHDGNNLRPVRVAEKTPDIDGALAPPTRSTSDAVVLDPSAVATPV